MGQRTVSFKLGFSHRRQNNNLYPYHKVREQWFTHEHARKRVLFGNWLLQNLGSDGPKEKWLKFSDFSAYIRTQPRHTSKNHVVYAREKSDIRSLLSKR